MNRETQNNNVWVDLGLDRENLGPESFRGLIERETLQQILDDTLKQEFIHLRNVYWFEDDGMEDVDAEEWKKSYQKGQLCRYGKGEYNNYRGDIYIRADSIISISPLINDSEYEGYNL